MVNYSNFSQISFLTIVFLLMGLSIKAQPFILDSAFSPFFDITVNHARGANITTIQELNSGTLLLSGDFEFNIPSGLNSDVIHVDRFGNRVASFVANVRDGGNLFWYNDSILGLAGQLGSLSFLDTLGNEKLIGLKNMYNTTVMCPNVAKPYVFKDGSLLVSNRNNVNFPNLCGIRIPPDTFPQKFIVKIDSTGKWDSTFTGNSNDFVFEYYGYDSSRILVSSFHHRFTHYNQQRVNGLCRIFKDGSLDTTFNSPFKNGIPGGVEDILVEDDGKIVVAGILNVNGFSNELELIRLNPDGSVDTTFFNNTQLHHPEFPNGIILNVIPTDDSGYIVAGSFDSIQGVLKNHLAKLDSNGILEPQYFTSIGPDSSTSRFANTASVRATRAMNGGLYVHGSFRYWNGSPSQPIVRLNPIATSTRNSRRENDQYTIKIFPNPSNDGEIFYHTTSVVEKIEIFGVSGNLLKTQESIENKINTPQIPGVYILRFTFGSGHSLTKKLLVN